MQNLSLWGHINQMIDSQCKSINFIGALANTVVAIIAIVTFGCEISCTITVLASGKADA